MAALLTMLVITTRAFLGTVTNETHADLTCEGNGTEYMALFWSSEGQRDTELSLQDGVQYRTVVYGHDADIRSRLVVDRAVWGGTTIKCTVEDVLNPMNRRVIPFSVPSLGHHPVGRPKGELVVMAVLIAVAGLLVLAAILLDVRARDLVRRASGGYKPLPIFIQV